MIARFILRFGLAIVFFWMGADKILHPERWAAQIPMLEPYIMIIAGVQIVMAILFLTRFHILSALLGALMLGGAAWQLGLTPNSIRDIGLLFACVALLLPWEHHLTPHGIMQNYRDLVRRKHKKGKH